MNNSTIKCYFAIIHFLFFHGTIIEICRMIILEHPCILLVFYGQRNFFQYFLFPSWWWHNRGTCRIKRRRNEWASWNSFLEAAEFRAGWFMVPAAITQFPPAMKSLWRTGFGNIIIAWLFGRPFACTRYQLSSLLAPFSAMNWLDFFLYPVIGCILIFMSRFFNQVLFAAY